MVKNQNKLANRTIYSAFYQSTLEGLENETDETDEDEGEKQYKSSCS